MCLKFSSGSWNILLGAWVWLLIFVFWRFRSISAHVLTSVLIRGQTNLSVSRRMVHWLLDVIESVLQWMSQRKDTSTYERNMLLSQQIGLVIVTRFSEVLFSRRRSGSCLSFLCFFDYASKSTFANVYIYLCACVRACDFNPEKNDTS